MTTELTEEDEPNDAAVLVGAQAAATRVGLVYDELEPEEQARARALATAVLEAGAPILRAWTLREAADLIQAMHPGQIKASVVFLLDQADRIERGEA